MIDRFLRSSETDLKMQLLKMINGQKAFLIAVQRVSVGVFLVVDDTIKTVSQTWQCNWTTLILARKVIAGRYIVWLFADCNRLNLLKRDLTAVNIVCHTVKGVQRIANVLVCKSDRFVYIVTRKACLLRYLWKSNYRAGYIAYKESQAGQLHIRSIGDAVCMSENHCCKETVNCKWAKKVYDSCQTR